MAASAASPPLTSPRIYLVRMVVFLTLAGFLAFVLYRQIVPAFMANPGLNGLILGATLIAIIMAFGQVQRLFREVRFANRTATGAADPGTPRVLGALAPALREARAGRPHPQGQFQPLLDSVASRLDEGREILRYIGGLLILLGLLGTFWGLIDTLSAVGGVIRSMRAGGGDAAVMFDELKSGLAVPLSGIGLAFSASLFGLAGSLVIGFLDLQAGQAHNRFYNELEDWLVTAAGPAPAPVPVPVTVPAAAALPAPPRPPEPPPRGDAVLKDIADAMTRLGTLVGDSTAHGRASTQAMANLAEGIQGLVQHMRAEQQMIRDWVEAQANRERELKQVLDRLAREKVE
ncbi:MotA/TolQ/ExbB proton channel family protein [Methylobacterium aquaticum]|uniref:MotA/TolQ/ExbB proton channel family protein n=1 Tax=Methylobacterium aquaticum TaxID=270351 RepID=UPI001931E264|nr:MotA/TolQ/ExbB proton channel family protein [Methylobacterium aquaticum]QRE75792.1 flagellar motor protein MotA [Methylobacterium aquaticum]